MSLSSFFCTQLNGSKYYVILAIQSNINHLFTQFNVKTVLFQTIQFNISHLFGEFRCQIVLGAIAMKGYSTFPKAPALPKPHHQIV